MRENQNLSVSSRKMTIGQKTGPHGVLKLWPGKLSKGKNTSKALRFLTVETHHCTYNGSNSVLCLYLRYKLTVQPPDIWGDTDANTITKGTPSKQRQYRQVRVPKVVINILRSWMNSRMLLNKTKSTKGERSEKSSSLDNKKEFLEIQNTNAKKIKINRKVTNCIKNVS